MLQAACGLIDAEMGTKLRNVSAKALDQWQRLGESRCTFVMHGDHVQQLSRYAFVDFRRVL